MNKYLEKFNKFRCKKEFLNIFKGKSMSFLKKEITEALAIKERLKRVLSNKSEDYILVEIGSGKGYFSVLMALFYKDLEIYMIDKNPNINLEHIKKFENIKFLNLDIRKKEFEEFFNELIKKNKKIIVVAIHLCQDNAKELVKFYNKFKKSIEIFILVPCCPGSFVKADKSVNVDPYLQWSFYLFNLIESKNKSMVKDKNMISERNIIIKAKKEKN